MYIREPKALAQALEPFVKDRVLVRYSVSGWGQASYNAELAVLKTICGEDFLYHTHISFFAMRGTTAIESAFKVIGLRNEPDILEGLARRWLSRSADDWCHGEQFMGAYEIYREGQLYTSIKLQSSDTRWHLLVGVILSELRAQQERVPAEMTVDTECHKLMSKRFSAFAAGNIAVWADQTLSAH